MSKHVNDLGDGDSSSSSDGHENTSFVKKVKSRVSDFIAPSLSKWFGAKVRHREEVDEDEACVVEPPSKRVRKYLTREENLFDMKLISTPVPPIHGQSHNPFSVTDPYKDPIAGPSSSSKQKRKLMLSTVPNHIKQPNRADRTHAGDSDSDRSDAQATVSMDKTNTVHGRSLFNTSLPLERTLFGGKMTSPQQHNASLSMRRPAFNASVFGTPNFMDKTLSTRRIINSPFYNGRITYGGASALSRTMIPTKQAESPSDTEVCVPKKAFDSNTSALSKTAKRILDTLDQYNSPVQDARRIPCPAGKRHRVDGLIGKYVGVNPYAMREPSKVPSNKELQVPTMSDLLKMKLKERLQESTCTVRELASNSSGSIITEEYTTPAHAVHDDNAARKKSTNKMKTKIASVRQRHNADDDAVPEVNLPNVQLPISTLPSFNITIPPSKPSPVATSTVDDAIKSTVRKEPLVEYTSITITPARTTTKTNDAPKATKPFVNFNEPEVKEIASKLIQPTNVQLTTEVVKPTAKQLSVAEFKFSKPIVIAQMAKSIKAINHFKFSKPMVKRANSLGAVTKKNIGFGNEFKLNSNQWECSVCLVRNDSASKSCVSCTTAKPITSNSKSEQTIVPQTKSSSWGDRFKPATGTWECSMCLVRNNASRNKCLACESPKATIPSIPAPKSDIETFKTKSDDVECPKCRTCDFGTEGKCLNCESLKPKLSTSKWGDKFKAPSSTWECCMCLVRNDIGKDQCDACENARPSNIVPPPKHGEGLMKENEWECPSCMVRNPNNKTRCVCCESSKSNSKSTTNAQTTEVPKFSFGIDNGLINGHGYVFGIPTNSASNKKVDSKASTIFEEEKKSPPAEVQYTFGVQSPNGAKTDVVNTSNEKPSLGGIQNAASPIFKNHFSPQGGANETRIVTAAQASSPEKTAFPLNGDKNTADAPTKKITFAVPGPTTTTIPTLTFGNVSKSPSRIENVSAKASTFDVKSNVKEPPPKSTPFGTPSLQSSTPAGGFSFPALAPSTMANTMFAVNAKPTLNGPASNFAFTPLTTNKQLPVDKVDNLLGANAEVANGSTTSIGSALFSGGLFVATTSTASTIPAFGASVTAPIPFNFTPSTTGPLAAKESFSHGIKKDDSTATAFGAPNPTSIFGSTVPSSSFSKSAENGVYTFGAVSGNSQEQPTETNKTPFQFGSTNVTPSPSAFKFGATAPALQTPQNGNGGYNFGSNANNVAVFDASAKPTFNFTAGSAPPMFTAQTSATNPPPAGRNFRKAIRRMR